MTLDGRYFFVSNIDLGVTRWTADAVRDFGLPYDKMYGGVPDWIDHVHPEDRAGVLAEFRDITSEKEAPSRDGIPRPRRRGRLRSLQEPRIPPHGRR